MVKVILTHLGCFDPKPLLTDPPHKSSNWFCHYRPQPLCKDSESKLKLFQAPRVADSQQSWKHFLMLTISASDLLLMGCTPTFFEQWGWEVEEGGWFFISFQKMMKFANYFIFWFALVFLWHLQSLYVVLLLKSLLLWFWLLCCEAANRLGFATVPHSSCEVTAAKHCHSSVTEEQKCD